MAETVLFFTFESEPEELAQQDGPLCISAKSEKMVQLLKLRMDFQTAVIKTGSDLAVEEPSLLLPQINETKWYKVIDSAHEKYCKVLTIFFKHLRTSWSLCTETRYREFLASS